MSGTVQTADRLESKLYVNRRISGGEPLIAGQIDRKGRVKIVTITLPINDRAWEMSWVFINRNEIEMSRLRHFNVEALPSSKQGACLQSPMTSVNGSKQVQTIGLPLASARINRLRFGYQRINLEVEYTRTNLG